MFTRLGVSELSCFISFLVIMSMGYLIFVEASIHPIHCSMIQSYNFCTSPHCFQLSANVHAPPGKLP